METESKKKPLNILFIVMDDQRTGSLGYNGSREVRTPCLDQLAAKGTVLKNCYVTTPICTPGRAELLTGCDSFTNGVPWFAYPIKPELTLLSTAFKQAGWHTAYFGKWHNDAHPSERDFEFTQRTLHDAHEFYKRYPEHGHDLIFKEDDGEVRGHSSELFTDATVDFLNAQKESDRPWLAYLAYHSPHDPFQPPEPYASEYSPETAEIPENFHPIHPFDNGDLSIRDELNLPWPRTPDAIRKYRSAYHGMVAHHDACIGRIMETLDANGQRDNTLVVFTSDHGLAIGCHGLLGKESMYDHSTKVPLVFSGPGVQSDQQLDGLCRNTDIYPTLCRMAGIDIPDSVADGNDLSDALHGTNESAAFRDSIFSQFSSPQTEPDETGWLPLKPTQRMVRSNHWKLIYYPQIARFQLFDLNEDPNEAKDLLAAWPYQTYRWGRQVNPRHAYQPTDDPAAILATAEELRQKMLGHRAAKNDSARPLLEKTPVELHD